MALAVRLTARPRPSAVSTATGVPARNDNWPPSPARARTCIYSVSSRASPRPGNAIRAASGFPVGGRVAQQVVFRLDAVDVADVFFRRDDEQIERPALVGPAVLAQQHAVGSRSQRLDIGYALLRRDLEFPDLETQDGRRRRYLFVVITAVREEIIQGEPFLGCPQTRLRQKRRPK